MALVAQLDENNVVVRVISVNDDLVNEGGTYSEAKALTFLQKVDSDPLAGWKQTDTEGSIRGNYASVGATYHEAEDIFMPEQPFPSWVENLAEARWVSPLGDAPTPPITVPESQYFWDEDLYQSNNSLGWVLNTPPTEPPPEP